MFGPKIRENLYFLLIWMNAKMYTNLNLRNTMASKLEFVTYFFSSFIFLMPIIIVYSVLLVLCICPIMLKHLVSVSTSPLYTVGNDSRNSWFVDLSPSTKSSQSFTYLSRQHHLHINWRTITSGQYRHKFNSSRCKQFCWKQLYFPFLKTILAKKETYCSCCSWIPS